MQSSALVLLVLAVTLYLTVWSVEGPPARREAADDLAEQDLARPGR